MPNYIIKLTDKGTDQSFYLLWSTVVDAPVTCGMNLNEFRKYYIDEYGKASEKGLDERLLRVEKNGTSGNHPFDDLKDLLSGNSAGENREEISYEQILDIYCINPR